MKTEGMFSESPQRIQFYHAAKRYLHERDPIAYERASPRDIEHIADMLRYEEFRRNAQPYFQQKERLLTRFYSLQTRPNAPIPEWLQTALDEWDDMIDSVARSFGYSPERTE